MPLLQRQSYRGLTRSTSKAAWHSLLLSSMASFSLPTRHWRITRYRELQLGFWLHISFAWMQSTHSDWAPGPELWGDPGELRTKDTDRAEGPTLELSPSSGWGQETDVKVTGEWFMCIRNQFYMLLFFLSFHATGDCMSRSHCTGVLLHVKESNGKTFTVHSSWFANSYTSYLFKVPTVMHLELQKFLQFPTTLMAIWSPAIM